MLTSIYSWVTAGLGILAVVALAFWATRPNRMREEEDDARAFFDEHGHWPDEPPPPPQD